MAIDTQPPVARKIPLVTKIHGHDRTDNYHWLRDKDRPEVAEYVKAENEYTAQAMRATQHLQDTIYREILGRTKQAEVSVPVSRSGYLYYSREQEGKEHPIYCRKKGTLAAAEEILLDPNDLAQGKPAFGLGALVVSEDQRLVAYSVDDDGGERYAIRIKDLASGKLLDDRLPKASAGLVWANDNRTLIYTTFDAAKRPEKIWRHVLGTTSDHDELLFTESDEQYDFEVTKTRSKKYILMTGVKASKTSEVRYLDADHPENGFHVVEPRTEGLEYYVEHQGDAFLIRTNADGAMNFKVMSVDVATPGRKSWKEILPARGNVMIEGVEAYRNHMVLWTREDGLPRVVVRNVHTGASHAVEFPEPDYNVSTHDNLEYNTATLRFDYTSLVTPPSIYDYNMDTRTRDLRKQTVVLGGYDPAKYEAERIWATAKDGKRIPVSLVHKKGLVLNGRNPVYLTAYGSYGLNSDVEFSIPYLSLIDRGFVVAIAHIRGGAEMGREWFEDGRLLHKKNTFTDFIACAEHLIAAGYTTPAKLTIRGASAGGLLMGAVVNMRPDLFHAVIARVPFVDVINTMLDASIPLTAQEWDQWGNPNEKSFYDYMNSYSPYDNVAAQAYPNLLVTAGWNDTRVAYWEPAKWVAKLRATKTDHNRLLLHTLMDAGHAGPTGRYDEMKETAFLYAFLLDTLGIKE